MFEIKNKMKRDVTVKDLIHFLQDCRPDAEVYVSYSGGTDDLKKVGEVINGGNYVQITYKL